MDIIETGFLDLKREYNIKKYVRNNIAFVSLIMAIFGLLAIAYEDALFTLPLILFLVVYVSMDAYYDYTSARNQLKISYMMRQDDYIVSIGKEAAKLMDDLEAAKVEKEQVEFYNSS